MLTVQKHAMDLKRSKSDYFIKAGKLSILTYIDTYKKSDILELWQIPNLPLMINGSLYNLNEKSRYIAVESGLKNEDRKVIIFNEQERNELLNLGTNLFVLKNPKPKENPEDICLANLFFNSFKYCHLEQVTKKEKRVYYTYIDHRHLLMFFPFEDKSIVLCDEKVTEEKLFLGYSSFQPPFGCVLETSEYTFDSRMGHDNLTITYKKSTKIFQNPDEIEEMDSYLNKSIKDVEDTLYKKLLEQYNKKDNSSFMPENWQSALIILAILLFFSIFIYLYLKTRSLNSLRNRQQNQERNEELLNKNLALRTIFAPDTNNFK